MNYCHFIIFNNLIIFQDTSDKLSYKDVDYLLDNCQNNYESYKLLCNMYHHRVLKDKSIASDRISLVYKRRK